jgi:hypothetical protein
MTEQVPPEAVEHVDPDLEGAPHEDAATSPEQVLRTGVPAVDDVLADVDRLAEAPLDEHLGAYERAHQSLRAALDDDPGEPA